MRGEVDIHDKIYKEKELLVFDQHGEKLELHVSRGSRLLVLNGEPINEPIVAHGPFVMNTTEEIQQAILDYQNGKMGRI